jgi:hypothetical protein
MSDVLDRPKRGSAATKAAMPKIIPVSKRISANGGERRYAVKWPPGHWTVETRKPSLASECLLAVDGVLEHA